MMASRMPNRGLRTANQKEMFQSEVVGFVFTLFSQAFEDGHFTKREILSACLERSSGDPCDAELSSANSPRPEVHRDQTNQWTEHCESNSDARNYRSGKLLIGRDRHALQTQFPSSGIELRRCDQLGLRSLHLTNVPNACTRSVAGINPGSAHQRGCSRECDYCADERTECRKPETCLHANYLKHPKIDVSENFETSCAFV